MKSIALLVVFGLFLKEGGILSNSKGQIEYSFTCPDTTQCYNEVVLKPGNYVFTGELDSFTIMVMDTIVYQLGEQTIRIEQPLK